MKIIQTPRKLNYACFLIGMVALWLHAHDWVVMLWAFISSLHFTKTIYSGKLGQEKKLKK